MVIYNITFHIDNSVLEECLIFLKKAYIPAILKDKTLDNPRLCKIMGDTDDGSTSYALQFEVESVDALNHWYIKNSELLNKRITDRFSDKVMGFTTLLQVLDHEEE